MSAATQGGAPMVRLELYSAQERFWHWLQALLIFGLLFTGAVVRYPDTFPVFDFKATVYLHNVLAVGMGLHAALALFFFFTSGQIKQYTVERKGFVSGVIKQVVYYSYGIFQGAQHPFHATARRRLNLLQRLTYLGLLNFLLPLQVISGAALLLAQHYPEVVREVGGLPMIVEVHALCAWFFFTFVIVHIYLTTTGTTLFQHVRTMIVGSEWVEAAHHGEHNEEVAP